MSRQIEMVFDEKTGKATAETKGIKGTDCEKALKEFNLGRVTGEKRTGEYYEPPAERNEVHKQKCTQ